MAAHVDRSFATAPLALLLACACCGETAVAPTTAPDDAGADGNAATIAELPECNRGTRSRELIADLGNVDARMLGAINGVVYWWTPQSAELWRMRANGSDRRAIGTTHWPSVLSDDGIYISQRETLETSTIARIPLEGGSGTTMGRYEHNFDLFAADVDSVYGRSQAPPSRIWRLPKDGSAPVELAPLSAGVARLGGDFIWLSDERSVGRIPSHSSSNPEVARVAPFGCGFMLAGSAGAACDHHGQIDLIPPVGSPATLVTDRSVTSLRPLVFAPQGGRPGVVFQSGDDRFLRWVATDGGPITDVACGLGLEGLAADGADLYAFASSRPTSARGSTRLVVRVSLR